MDRMQPATRANSLDLGLSDSSQTRIRANIEVGTALYGTANRSGAGSCSPTNMSKALESMLKTTTETGDIGLFSIKPPRVPTSISTPRRTDGYDKNVLQRPRQNFQPYSVPIVDDRRCLPSYARDVTSEVSSMFETVSQKSARRVFEDPDFRSYSMTQTSYSAPKLSSHRSYTSLRSQPDGGLYRRPRSPFAYPTRLKRPGFRPSSPALTDGACVDYIRRAETDRLAHGSGHSTSSPSSLYAQKRKLPLSLRPEPNRSTQSLLSQISPPRRTPSPRVRYGNLSSGHEYSRRNDRGSGAISPARSTFSLASTINFYASGAVPSTSTTPGKVPPSPLYYDYTEEFDIDMYNEPEALPPPPQFRIDTTIPEDLPMSAEGQYIDGRDHSTNSIKGACLSSPTALLLQKSMESRNMRITSHGISDPGSVGAIETRSERLTLDPKLEDTCRNTNTIRLSGLGVGARELHWHVEEAFGLSSSDSFEISIPVDKVSIQQEAIHDQKCQIQDVQDSRSESAESSSYSPEFPSPPTSQDVSRKQLLAEPIQPGIWARSSSLEQIGSIGLNELMNTESAKRSNGHGFEADSRGSMNSDKSRAEMLPTADKSVLYTMTSTGNAIPTPSSFNLRKQANHLEYSETPKKSYSHRKTQLQSIASYGQYDVLKPSDHSRGNTMMPRSESPMLAPKPISPARQLKLKNSIPQLMKALPPLPPEPVVCTLPPPIVEENLSSSIRHPCRPSNLPTPVSHINNAHVQARSFPDPNVADAQKKPESTSQKEKDQNLVSLDSKFINNVPVLEAVGKCDPDSIFKLRKLKLKMRNSVTLPPIEISDSQAWNLAENSAWDMHNSIVEVVPIIQENKPAWPTRPRFKLRVTRASNSTQGTVRIHRESKEIKQLASLNLRSPKDLFTTPGVDDIIRHVSRHLHPKLTKNDSPVPTPTQIFWASTESPAAKSSNALEKSSIPTTPLGTAEALSIFSNDSSHAEKHQSVRKRFSNLRARIPVPYVTNIGTQSYDDITWKDRHGAQPSSPSASRSTSNLLHGRTNAGSKPTRRFLENLHRHRLKTKVQSWIKGARLAIVARVKSRSSTASGLG